MKHDFGHVYSYLLNGTKIHLIPPYLSALDFWKIEFEKSSWTNLIFCLFQTWFLLLVWPAKIKFKIDKNSSSSNLIFQSWFFKNQVQVDRTLVSSIRFQISQLVDDALLFSLVVNYVWDEFFLPRAFVENPLWGKQEKMQPRVHLESELWFRFAFFNLFRILIWKCLFFTFSSCWIVD